MNKFTKKLATAELDWAQACNTAEQTLSGEPLKKELTEITFKHMRTCATIRAEYPVEAALMDKLNEQQFTKIVTKLGLTK